MEAISSFARDERSARIAVACMVEPSDSVTGELLRRVGAVETLRLAGSDVELPGRGKAETGVWRKAPRVPSGRLPDPVHHRDQRRGADPRR